MPPQTLTDEDIVVTRLSTPGLGGAQPYAAWDTDSTDTDSTDTDGTDADGTDGTGDTDTTDSKGDK